VAVSAYIAWPDLHRTCVGLTPKERMMVGISRSSTMPRLSLVCAVVHPNPPSRAVTVFSVPSLQSQPQGAHMRIPRALQQ